LLPLPKVGRRDVSSKMRMKELLFLPFKIRAFTTEGIINLEERGFAV